MNQNPETRPFFLIVSSYLIVYVIWGTTYYFIKIAVVGIEPYLMVGLRFLAGGILLCLTALITGRLKKAPAPREIGSAVLLGSLLLILGNGLVTLAEKKVDSYIAALVVSSTPITIALLNKILFRKKIGIPGTVGILAGFTGTALILYQGGFYFSGFSIYTLFVIGGMLSFSLGTAISHRLPVHPDPMINSGLQMLFVGIVCTILTAFLRPNSVPQLLTAGVDSVFALGYLVFFGTLAYLAYNYLLKHEPSGRISSYALVNPVIAVIVGILIGREKATRFLFMGLPMVFSGLILMFYGKEIFQRLIKIRIMGETK